MQNDPYLYILVLIYIVLVGIPVYLLNRFWKKRLGKHPNLVKLLLYFITLIVVALAMHFVSLWIYLSFVLKR